MLSNFRIVPLTGQFNDRVVQYRLSAHVTGPGNVTGGHLRVTPPGAGLKRQSANQVAKAPAAVRSVRAAETTCSLDSECVVELTRSSCASEHECDVEGIWRVNKPPNGRHERSLTFVQSDEATSNEIRFVVDIKDPPPPPPPPGPSFADTIGVTFLHPRCQNCHGFRVPNAIGVVHQARPPTCSLCHTVPGWTAPAATFDLASKTLPQMCEVFKASRGNNPSVIEHHLKDDVLIQWAIIDGTVLGNPRPGGLAPPGNLGTWNARASEWINGGMSCG